MTVLVALSTKDALVMGCDSLGSTTKPLVDPFDLVAEYFETEGEWKLKTDKNGKPILKGFNDIYKKAQHVPFDHMTHMTKLFSLDPLEMAVMITGITSIGERTIKSLVSEFKNKKMIVGTRKPANYTIKSISEKLLKFVHGFYDTEYEKLAHKPKLEFLVGGYDKRKQVPTIYRIFVHDNKLERTFDDNNPFGIAFGGQTQEIQRIVFGTDGDNKIKLLGKIGELLEKYRMLLQEHLKTKGITEELPGIKNKKYRDKLNPFKDWEFNRFVANWGDFSEQNAIECVNFFAEIMIKSQQFSASLPTVGGDVHIGLITKDKGFKFISREEYVHEGHTTPIGGGKPMSTSMKYLTVEESEIHKKIAKKYNIKGYSTSTSLMCSPSCAEFETGRRGSKTVRKAKERKVKR